MRGGTILVCILLAGCVSEAPSASVPAPDAPGTAPPVELVAPTFRAPLRLGLVEGNTGAEPSVLVTARGVVLVAAPPHLWRSLDGGQTFEALDASSLAAFDGDVDFSSDANGTIYYVGLDQGTSTPFQLSRDDGATWTEPVDLADGRSTDRQWIEAYADGTLLATWRDQDDATEDLRVRRSPDGGATWDSDVSIAPDTILGPTALDERSRAAYAAYYRDGLVVARSLDEGATWTHHPVTSESRDMTLRSGRPIDMFPIVDVDAAGTVYLAWAADAPDTPLGAKELTVSRVWLAVSRDGGETWDGPRAVSPEGKTAIFPWIVAGADGRIALTWYEARSGAPGHLTPDAWDVRLVESADGGESFVGGLANRDPVHLGAICRSGGGCDRLCSDVTRGCLPTRVCDLDPCVGKDRSRAEFFELALTPDGHPIVAWVADARAPEVGIEIHVGGVANGTPLT